MKRLNKKGFTLVELLAVIVVLAIVAVIAMQSITTIINKNRMDSFTSSAQTVLDSVSLACLQNGTENDLDDDEIEAALKSYVKDYDTSSIDISVTDKKVIITPKAGKEFANIKGDNWKNYENNKFPDLTFSKTTTVSISFDYKCTED